MQICHLAKYYPPAIGGIETHVRTLAQAQADLGLDVRVVCFDHHSDRPTTHEMDGKVSVTRLRAAWKVAGVQYCPELISVLSGIKSDLIHLHVPNPVMILSLIAAKSTIPVVVTYHSDIVRQRVRYFFIQRAEHYFYRRVRKILCTTDAYFEGSSFLRRHREVVSSIPLGIELHPYLSPSDAEMQEAKQIQARFPGPLWLYCGRLVSYKGLENALLAIRNTPGTLVIVGDGPERDRLQSLSQRWGVTDRVVFTGELQPHRAMVPYYLAAYAFWFPCNQKSEAFGTVQVEAMASGCPIINTAIPGSGVAWVSRHEETGLTVKVNDPEALAKASLRLFQDPELRNRLGTAARHRARQEFDHVTMAKRYLSVYESVLGSSLQFAKEA